MSRNRRTEHHRYIHHVYDDSRRQLRKRAKARQDMFDAIVEIITFLLKIAFLAACFDALSKIGT